MLPAFCVPYVHLEFYAPKPKALPAFHHIDLCRVLDWLTKLATCLLLTSSGALVLPWLFLRIFLILMLAALYILCNRITVHTLTPMLKLPARGVQFGI